MNADEDRKFIYFYKIENNLEKRKEFNIKFTFNVKNLQRDLESSTIFFTQCFDSVTQCDI